MFAIGPGRRSISGSSSGCSLKLRDGNTTIGLVASLDEEIVRWLEREREGTRKFLTRHAIPPVERVMMPIATENADGGLTTQDEEREVNPLSTAFRLAGLSWDTRVREPSPAAALYAAFGNDCWFQQSYMQPKFDEEPVLWIEQRLLEPVAWRYVRGVGRLDQPDDALARALAREILDLVSGDSVTARTYVVLESPYVKTALSSGSVTVRPLTPEELGQLHRFRPEDVESVFRAWGHMRGKAMLELTEGRPKKEWPQPTGLIERVLLGLHLLGIPVAGGATAFTREFPVPMGTTGKAIPMAQYGEATALTQAQLDAAVRLAGTISDSVALDPRKAHEIALSRFLSAHGNRTPTDALIDLVVALEAVLLPREAEGELSFRLALFGSFACGVDRAERSDLYRLFKHVYDTRSKIVHGSRVEGPALQEVARTAKLLTSRVLRRGLESGWMSQDELRAAVLSGGSDFGK
jgi:hypothetical protein